MVLTQYPVLDPGTKAIAAIPRVVGYAIMLDVIKPVSTHKASDPIISAIHCGSRDDDQSGRAVFVDC